MKLFLFLQLFFLISLTYGTRDEASSSQPVVLSEDDKIRDSDCVCRLEAKNRIIGGEEALAHSIPWQVSLADSGGKHFCGATIINPNYVLTSASCIKVKKEEDIKVRVGLHNINDPIPEENIFDIEEIYYYISTHPFVPNEPLAEGDIALLQLKKKIKFALGKVEPACLNFIEKPKYEDKLMISGWGFTNSIALNKEKKIELIGEFSPVLKIAYLNQDTENCESPPVICTKSDKEESPSKGDEGGPLHSKSGLFTTVEAVLSEIDKVYESNDIFVYPGKQISIYSRISFYENWFEKIIGNNYCNKDLAARRLRDFFSADIPPDLIDPSRQTGLSSPINLSGPLVPPRPKKRKKIVETGPIDPSNKEVSSERDIPYEEISKWLKIFYTEGDESDLIKKDDSWDEFYAFFDINPSDPISSSDPIAQSNPVDSSNRIGPSNPPVLPNTHASSSSSKKGKKIVESGPMNPSNTEVYSEIDIDLWNEFYEFFNIDPYDPIDLSDPIGILRPVVHSDQIVQPSPKVPSDQIGPSNPIVSPPPKKRKIVQSDRIDPSNSEFSSERDIPDEEISKWLKSSYTEGDESDLIKKNDLWREFYEFFKIKSDISDHLKFTIKIGRQIKELFPTIKQAQFRNPVSSRRFQKYYRFLKKISDPIGLSRPIIQSDRIDPSNSEFSSERDIPDEEISKWLKSSYTKGDESDLIKNDDLWREFYEFFKIKKDISNHHYFTIKIGTLIKELFPNVRRAQFRNQPLGLREEYHRFLKKI